MKIFPQKKGIGSNRLLLVFNRRAILIRHWFYNAECKSGGVQKLSKAVFCTCATAEKLAVLHQINGELLSCRFSAEQHRFLCGTLWMTL